MHVADAAALLSRIRKRDNLGLSKINPQLFRVRLIISNFMPRILLLTDHSSYRIAPYIDACARLQIDVIVGTEGKSSLVPHPKSGISLDFSNPTQSLEALSMLYEESPFDGVVATDDAVVQLAAEVADMFRLPANAPSAVNKVRRKDSSREAQREAGLRVPGFHVVSLDDRIETKDLNSVAYPCVAKPVTLSASCGVIRANNPSELSEAMSRIAEIIRAAGPHHPRVCLVEEFIKGREYVVEGLINQGKWQTLALIEKPELMEGLLELEC